MKAAVLRAPKVLEVGEIATPQAGPGELILKVRAATVCGTDLRILSGKKTKGIRFPSVIGHEFAGVVAHAGDGVTAFKVGDRVCMDPVVPCRACAYCKAGLENVCQNRQAMGYEFDGAFAEYIRIPAIALQPTKGSQSVQCHAIATDPKHTSPRPRNRPNPFQIDTRSQPCTAARRSAINRSSAANERSAVEEVIIMKIGVGRRSVLGIVREIAFPNHAKPL